MRTASLALAVIVAGFAAGALAQSSEPKPSAESGRAMSARWCKGCHIIEEGQTRGMDGAPSFIDLARDEAVSPDGLRAFLNAPQHPMPPIDLSREQIDDLIAYINTLH